MTVAPPISFYEEFFKMTQQANEELEPKALWRAMGIVVRMMRESKGLKQDELAIISGVPRRTLSNIEIGDSDKLKHFVPIAWSLGTRLATIVAKAEALILDEEQLEVWSRRYDSYMAEREADEAS